MSLQLIDIYFADTIYTWPKKPSKNMISKIWKEYQVIIVMVPLIIGSHMGWKYLQDIGVGDKGRDYPIKKFPEVYGKVISEKLWPEKTEDEKGNTPK